MISDQINLLTAAVVLVQNHIKERNSAGFNEYSPLLESFTKHAMETIHGEEFINLNRIAINKKAIDLINSSGTIVIQVTANANGQKIYQTIDKFTEKDKKTGRSVKDDYPNAEKLFIFGFCSAADPGNLKNDIPDYCEIITPRYFFDALQEKLDENAVARITDKLRNISHFQKIHPIADEPCLRIMLTGIDRDAIKHTMEQEGSYEYMTKSLRDLKLLINEGKNSDGQVVCKGRLSFVNDDYSEFLDSVAGHISKILSICNIATNDYGSICFSDPQMVEIDAHKKAINDLTTAMRSQLKKVKSA